MTKNLKTKKCSIGQIRIHIIKKKSDKYRDKKENQLHF